MRGVNAGNPAPTEGFAYDVLNRLQEVTLNNVQTLDVDYDDAAGNTGNIKYKSDYGTYTYGQWGAGPRQVSQVSGPESMTYHYDANGNLDCRGWNVATQTCTPTGTADELQWTSFNLPKRIEHGSDYAALAYGPDRQRVKDTRLTAGGALTRYVAGPHFQKELAAGLTRFRHNVLVDGQIVYFQVDDEIAGDGHTGTSYVTYAYYVHRDHQGSIDEITHAWGTAGAPVPYSYDAFGKRREADWTADTDESQLYVTSHMATRGYTGHEHLDVVGLIHMNGRVQDPILGRMISRDPLVGDIGNPETLNRYAYAGNNPATYTDPTGYSFAGCDSDPQGCDYPPPPPGPDTQDLPYPGPDSKDGFWYQWIDLDGSRGLAWMPDPDEERPWKTFAVSEFNTRLFGQFDSLESLGASINVADISTTFAGSTATIAGQALFEGAYSDMKRFGLERSDLPSKSWQIDEAARFGAKAQKIGRLLGRASPWLLTAQLGLEVNDAATGRGPLEKPMLTVGVGLTAMGLVAIGTPTAIGVGALLGIGYGVADLAGSVDRYLAP